MTSTRAKFVLSLSNPDDGDDAKESAIEINLQPEPDIKDAYLPDLKILFRYSDVDCTRYSVEVGTQALEACVARIAVSGNHTEDYITLPLWYPNSESARDWFWNEHDGFIVGQHERWVFLFALVADSVNAVQLQRVIQLQHNLEI